MTDNAILDRLKAIRTNLERLMKAHDIGAKPLALRAGLGETSVRDFLKNEDRDIRVGTILKLAEVLECSFEEIVSPWAGQSVTVPNGEVLAALFEGMIQAIPDEASSEQKARILSIGLPLGLQLLARRPTIHDNLDAIRAIGESVAVRVPPSMQ